MDGEAILAALDIGQEALAPIVPSVGKRLKLYTILKHGKVHSHKLVATALVGLYGNCKIQHCRQIQHTA